ncbi:MAG: universal stress protein [Candidatus Helarchaeota archaeon]
MPKLLFRKILLAIDGSENSMKAAERGLELAKAYNGEIYALFVIDTNLVTDLLRFHNKTRSEIVEQMKEKGCIYVDTIEKLCKKYNLKCSSIIEEGTVSELILRESKKNDVDLIVMAHHSQRGTESMRLGSVCNGVLDFTPCPVLIYKEKH